MRAEWFRDDDGFRVAPAGDYPNLGVSNNPASAGGFEGDFYEIAYGLNYKPTGNSNFILRPELRYDWYDGAANAFGQPARTTTARPTTSSYTASTRSTSSKRLEDNQKDANPGRKAGVSFCACRVAVSFAGQPAQRFDAAIDRPLVGGIRDAEVRIVLAEYIPGHNQQSQIDRASDKLAAACC